MRPGEIPEDGQMGHSHIFKIMKPLLNQVSEMGIHELKYRSYIQLRYASKSEVTHLNQHRRCANWEGKVENEEKGEKRKKATPFIEVKDLKDGWFECHRLFICGNWLEVLFGGLGLILILEGKMERRGSGHGSSRWKLKVKTEIWFDSSCNGNGNGLSGNIPRCPLLPRTLHTHRKKIPFLFLVFLFFIPFCVLLDVVHGPFYVGSTSDLIWFGPSQSPKNYGWVRLETTFFFFFKRVETSCYRTS